MIDILLATYNGEKYLYQQIDSILSQTYTDFHLYIKDDGSMDNTLSIIKNYQIKNSSKITFIENTIPTGSAKNNFFEMLMYSKSDYIMFADQDDVWNNDKVLITFKAINKYKKPALVHTDMQVTDENLVEINPSFINMQKLNTNNTSLNKLICQNNVTGCTMCINKQLKELIMFSDDALQHDWWISIICAAFGNIEFINKCTVKYRQHGKNEVGAKDVRSGEYIANKMANTNDVHISIIDTYKQAESFLKSYEKDLKHEQITMLEAFCGLRNSSVFKRIKVLSKYKIFKSGLYRKIGQIIYG